MYELSVEQIDSVTRLVSNSEITYSHLPEDLIDHICCDIESEMSIGLSFNKALERVKCKFGDNGLERVQEDTILLIDQKYRFMKTTMKIFGNVSLALIGIGTIFKLYHWPMATAMLLLGFVFLAFIFYPSTIMANYRKNGRKRILIHVLALLGGIPLMIGILFKVNHWPLATILLSVGWFILLFVLLPIWFFKKIKEIETKREKTMYAIGALGLILFELSTLFKIQHWPGAAMLLLVGAILIVSVFTPMYAKIISKKTNYVSEKYIYVIIVIIFFTLFGTLININFSKRVWSSLSNTNYYAQVEYEYYNSQNNNMLSQVSNADLLLIHEKADEICKEIDKTKMELIIRSQDINESEVTKYMKDINLLNNKYEHDVVNKVFFGNGDKPYASLFKNQLLDFKKIILKNQPELENEIEKLLNLEDINSHGVMQTWEKGMFSSSSLYVTLIQLSNISRNIRVLENLIYSNILLEEGIDNEKIVSNL